MGQSPKILPQLTSAPTTYISTQKIWVDPLAKVFLGNKMFYREVFLVSSEALTAIYTYFLVSASK